MPNTYSQITIHAVFAVKHRENFILKEWRDDLHRYISGIITNKGAKSLAVGGWKDHVHILFGMPVTDCIADFMSVVKANSSKWINEQQFIKGKFQWQEGYGVFTVGWRERDAIKAYIAGQEDHHRKKAFREELIELLNEAGVEFDPKYLP